MTASRRHWIVTVVGTLGMTGALIMAQLLVSRTGLRFDLTPERRHVLSDHARQILAALDNDVRLTAFLRSDDPRNRDITELLTRMAAASPRIRTAIVDVNRNPAVAGLYGVDVYGAVVVESDGRRAAVSQPGEQAITAAVLQVTRPSRRVVYFLTGHGERSIRDRDRRWGYSQARLALMQELYDVEEIGGDRPGEIPPGAAAVIVAGPRGDLPDEVLDELDAYVRGGGGVLVLLDPRPSPGLVGLLRRWGVRAPEEVVVDSENRLFAGDFLTIQVPGLSRANPVTAVLRRPPLMSQVRPLFAAPGSPAPEVVELLRAGERSWRTTDFDVVRTGKGRFVAGRDQRGPVPVGVSILVPDHGDGPGRVIAIGDSDFASNAFLDYLGNRDLFLNAVDWLAHEEGLIAVRPAPQTPGVNQLFVSARQGRTVFLLGTVALPLTLLTGGFVVAFVRRRAR